MMAVRAPMLPGLSPGASSASMVSEPSFPIRGRSPGMVDQHSDTYDHVNHVNSSSSLAPTRSPKKQADPSSKHDSTVQTMQQLGTASIPAADQGNIYDLRGNSPALGQKTSALKDTKRGLVSPLSAEPLKIDTESPTAYTSSAQNDEPVSVIHAPRDFGKFDRSQPSPPNSAPSSKETTPTTESTDMSITALSETSSESVASDITVTRLVGEDTETLDRFSQMPPLQTQIPIAPEWTKTPRAQTRKDLGVFSRPSSTVHSLASISEAEDDHPDHPTDISADEAEDEEDRLTINRNDEEDIQTLQTTLTQCWTLCNTLAGLSYVHREKIFSKKGNMQQQAWRSCWKLCQNLYDARNEASPMNVRLTLDLCREFCQALFDVRARGDDAADSVLRVSFELNNHLFNTHDRSLPEAFSERTLDFYITLCHRLMKQRSSIAEETGPLLKACWGLAEMLFSIRQNKREGRGPDEDLLSSAIQACWELCDLFREGWTQVRPERHTPRPAQTTLTEALQQARKAASSTPNNGQPKLYPETPTTIFEDIAAESPYEDETPNIVVLRPGTASGPTSAISANSTTAGKLKPRMSAYRWPSPKPASSVTTISTSSSKSHANSVQTIRSPSDDPNNALLKSLFLRAAMQTNRGFSPLSATSIGTVSSMTSLPLFVKSLPESAFGQQTWQTTLLDNYRKAVNNDHTFRSLGVAASPTLLGIEGDDTTQTKIRNDMAKAVQTIVGGTYGWSWLKDLFRLVFGVYIEDVLLAEERR